MTKRRTITARLARDIIIRQIAEGSIVRNNGSARIACALCGGPISTCEKTEWEHMQALERGGADDETNIRLSHRTCSKRKTFGKGATTRGSDIGEIAKTKRLEKAREALERGDEPKPKTKIQSRGFGNSKFKRKFDGSIVEREDATTEN